MQRYIVKLKEGMWLTSGDGDPPRSTVMNDAKIYTYKQAERDLKKARKLPYRDGYPDAKILNVYLSLVKPTPESVITQGLSRFLDGISIFVKNYVILDSVQGKDGITLMVDISSYGLYQQHEIELNNLGWELVLTGKEITNWSFPLTSVPIGWGE